MTPHVESEDERQLVNRPQPTFGCSFCRSSARRNRRNSEKRQRTEVQTARLATPHTEYDARCEEVMHSGVVR